eukprot:symbB.v1.2.025252.t1/scaffold2440.1/size78978/3
MVPSVPTAVYHAVPPPRPSGQSFLGRRGCRAFRSSVVARRGFPTFPEDPQQALLVVGLGAWALNALNAARRRAEVREVEERVEAQRRERMEERKKKAYLARRKEPWTSAELQGYDGTDEDGPILVGCDGVVFNVWRSSHFYAPGCEYHILAGRDATRLLAKNKLEEETEEEARQPLTLAEQATVQAWLLKLKSKHDVVGYLND